MDDILYLDELRNVKQVTLSIADAIARKPREEDISLLPEDRIRLFDGVYNMSHLRTESDSFFE